MCVYIKVSCEINVKYLIPEKYYNIKRKRIS